MRCCETSPNTPPNAFFISVFISLSGHNPPPHPAATKIASLCVCVRRGVSGGRSVGLSVSGRPQSPPLSPIAVCREGAGLARTHAHTRTHDWPLTHPHTHPQTHT